ncbi:DUF222 domain-containing protein [Galbitalea sp. SE-J8]|uniref:HNH endonuclease signature motif containing protein n=1 Tax=Galbitalea sp. SE-J8 TaxID=3054952 RepID=UPI00259D2EB3|nr:HNH endonuclease signature motif containing protein [Galbitalea sp. SE-J8]MDM4762823.1 DUF222 domain-containing protein [Galbitalea sp. SE-J8]
MAAADGVRFVPTDGSGDTASPNADAPLGIRIGHSVTDLFDAAARTREMAATLDAWQAQFIENAVRLKMIGVECTQAATADGWTAEVVAMRELSSELGCRLGISDSAARALIERSCSLVRTLPHTLQALERGTITVRHAHVVVDEAGSLPAEAVPEYEAAVLERASVPIGRFTRLARALRERMHPESMATRAVEALEKRHVGIEPARDGMAWLTAHLPAEEAVAIDTRLTAAARAGRVEGEERTIAQLRADLLAHLLIDGECSGVPAGIRPSVLVTVPVLTLLGADAPAQLEGHGPIDAETARRLAADAPSFTRLLTHPETSAVLSYGKDAYAVPADLRRALRARDQRCRYVTCDASVAHAEADHTDDFAGTGQTALDNLAFLCRGHHHLKHRTGWKVEQHEGGVLVWTSPEGLVYVDRPEPTPGACTAAEVDAFLVGRSITDAGSEPPPDDEPPPPF